MWRYKRFVCSQEACARASSQDLSIGCPYTECSMSAARTLRDIAEESAFAAADVAYLSGLDEATVSRLWERPDWLDRIKGQSLQALIAVVPGLGTHVIESSMAGRRQRLFEELEGCGISVNLVAWQRLLESGTVPEQHLASALEAAGHVLRGDVRLAASHLARFWGQVQDHSLGYVYADQERGGLLHDRDRLVEASVSISDQMAAERSRSFHAALAQANLSHQVARATGELQRPKLERGQERQASLTYRSAVMGVIIETNDLDLARRYCRQVETEPILALVEAWAFPTYTRDWRPGPDLSVPRSLLLRNTAAE